MSLASTSNPAKINPTYNTEKDKETESNLRLETQACLVPKLVSTLFEQVFKISLFKVKIFFGMFVISRDSNSSLSAVFT